MVEIDEETTEIRAAIREAVMARSGRRRKTIKPESDLKNGKAEQTNDGNAP